MLDQSFNFITLQNEIKKSDFFKRPNLKNEANLKRCIDDAVALARNAFSEVTPFHSLIQGGKQINRIINYESELILRKINRNLTTAFNVNNSNRNHIIKNIKGIASEGVPYCVLRLDVKSFYESFSIEQVKHLLVDTHSLSNTTGRLVFNLLDRHQDNGGQGLPRGISLSGILAEILMRPFDDKITSMPDVYFYTRFVDDILLITNCDTSPRRIIRTIKDTLPTGLTLNQQKLQIRQAKACAKLQSGAKSNVLTFDYLGYKFTVSDPVKGPGQSKGKASHREVQLDISDAKVRKIKTRIVRCIISYCKSSNYDLLIDRIKFLTGNFNVPDIDRDRNRLAGIYYNYNQIDEQHSKALDELDSFLLKAAISSNGSIFEDFFLKSTPSQRRRLLAYSFRRGFSEKKHNHFSNRELATIKRCWQYA